MKRFFSILLILCFLFSAAACSGTVGELQSAETSEPDATVEPEATNEPAEPDEPSDEADSEPNDDEGDAETAPALDWENIYRNFLSENYSAISEQLYGSIAGIGFIDLDLDGTPELVLFDPGASASMGVQFFDITSLDGDVECVSANILGVGELFGGDNLTMTYVNANYFEDFRLAEADDGSRFFYVNSGNGGIDFSYTELIEFSGKEVGDDGIVVLKLTSLLYRSDNYDEETNERIESESRYTYLSKDVTADEYDSYLEQFNATHTDTDYEGFGVFMWENKAYTSDAAGFEAMLDDAIAGYVAIPEE